MPRTRKDYLSPVDEKTIGSHLRELRKRRGFTQLELAEKLGIRQSLISGYESGSVRMHSALLAAFAKALHASADEILGLTRIRDEPPAIKDRRFVRRLERIDRLPKRQRQILLGTIDAVLKSSAVA